MGRSGCPRTVEREERQAGERERAHRSSGLRATCGGEGPGITERGGRGDKRVSWDHGEREAEERRRRSAWLENKKNATWNMEDWTRNKNEMKTCCCAVSSDRFCFLCKWRRCPSIPKVFGESVEFREKFFRETTDGDE